MKSRYLKYAGMQLELLSSVAEVKETFLHFTQSHSRNMRCTLRCKSARKVLGLNFINVLRTAFTLADPESIRRY
jgi:hypothetical protein